MMQSSEDKWQIGICSWSLDDNITNIAQAMKNLGLRSIHLSLNQAIDNKDENYIVEVLRQNWNISATMVGFPQEDYTSIDSIRKTGGIMPDDAWPDNFDRVKHAIALTADIGVKYLEFHFGFLDHSSSEALQKFTARTLALADLALQWNIVLLMETGQESASALQSFLLSTNHPSLAVNFDPGNMLLYGSGNPIAAVKTLAPWIKNVHCKDAIASGQADVWGKETAWGKGQLDTSLFLKTLKENNFQGILNIERECGDTQLEDIRMAAELLRANKF